MALVVGAETKGLSETWSGYGVTPVAIPMLGLADSLNAMLERIENLLYGLKDVSNNIAHDLKTPLTRLRNRVEAALAGDAEPGDYREALESTILGELPSKLDRFEIVIKGIY